MVNSGLAELKGQRALKNSVHMVSSPPNSEIILVSFDAAYCTMMRWQEVLVCGTVLPDASMLIPSVLSYVDAQYPQSSRCKDVET
jgi:hypothetical protein